MFTIRWYDIHVHIYTIIIIYISLYIVHNNIIHITNISLYITYNNIIYTTNIYTYTHIPWYVIYVHIYIYIYIKSLLYVLQIYIYINTHTIWWDWIKLFSSVSIFYFISFLFFFLLLSFFYFITFYLFRPFLETFPNLFSARRLFPLCNIEHCDWFVRRSARRTTWARLDFNLVIAITRCPHCLYLYFSICPRFFFVVLFNFSLSLFSGYKRKTEREGGRQTLGEKRAAHAIHLFRFRWRRGKKVDPSVGWARTEVCPLPSRRLFKGKLPRVNS